MGLVNKMLGSGGCQQSPQRETEQIKEIYTGGLGFIIPEIDLEVNSSMQIVAKRSLRKKTPR